MTTKEWQVLVENLERIQKLLILLLKKNDITGVDISKAMGISEGNLSKLLNSKKYKSK